MTPLRQRFIDDLRLHHYAPTTIRAYVRSVVYFAKFCKRCPSQVGQQDIRDFQLHMIRQQAAFGHFNVCVCALKAFYTITLQRPDYVAQLPYARRRKHLPTILSTDEVAQLLAAADLGRDRLLLQTAYALGLRVGELVQIQARDIDSPRHLLRVHGKGSKERLVPFTPELLQQWRDYWRSCRRQVPSLPWLFLNRNADGPISIQRVQAMCAKVVRRSGLRKRISMHTLRHCFATHLLEANVDLVTLQRLLGHRFLRTTAEYLHLTERRLEQVSDVLRGFVLPSTPAAEGQA